MQASKDIVLYSYFRSSSTWRVRIALNMKKIQYEYKFIHLLKKENNDDDYLKLNPQGQVPALFIDGNTFTQSLPICEYLEDTRPEHPLYPKDPIQRAKVRAICEIINSGIQPYQNLPLLNTLEKNGVNKIEFAGNYVGNGLRILEEIISKTRGKYCFGDEVTLADAFMVPQFASAARFNVDTTPFKNLVEINEALSQLEEFKNAAPQAQPDFEG